MIEGMPGVGPIFQEGTVRIFFSEILSSKN